MSFVDLHYVCGAVLFASSMIGCFLPYQSKFDVTPVRPMSTGIIFGVAICHLLPDSSQILDTLVVTEWYMSATRLNSGSVGDDGLYDTLPVAEALMCLGIFIMLVIDQCIPCPHHQVQNMMTTTTTTSGVTDDDASAAAAAAVEMKGGEQPRTTSETARLLPVHHASNGGTTTNGYHHGNGGGCCSSSGGGHHHHHHGGGVAKPRKLPNAKVYATEVAIAIHSIIIGFTMGVNPRTDSLVGFTVAMIFHQMFEGIALAMIARQGRLTTRALAVLVTVFASSLPTGIWIGKTFYDLAKRSSTSSSAEDGGDGDDDGADLFTIFFQGVPNAVASGMLLHIGFELMMEDFHHHGGNGGGSFPASKLALAFGGGAAIIFLAVWA